MIETEELVGYEDSGKDDQRWIDGSREGNPLTDELGNIGEGPDESLAIVTKESDQIATDVGEEVLVVSKSSSSADVGMSEVHGFSKANKPQERTINEVCKPTATSTDNALATSSAPPVEEDDIIINRELIVVGT